MSKKTKEEFERRAREIGRIMRPLRDAAAVAAIAITRETEEAWEEDLARWRADQASSSDYDVN